MATRGRLKGPAARQHEGAPAAARRGPLSDTLLRDAEQDYYVMQACLVSTFYTFLGLSLENGDDSVAFVVFVLRIVA